MDQDICTQFEQMLATCAKHAIAREPTEFCKKLLDTHTTLCSVQNPQNIPGK
jgi:hypothetical protein